MKGSDRVLSHRNDCNRGFATPAKVNSLCCVSTRVLRPQAVALPALCTVLFHVVSRGSLCTWYLYICGSAAAFAYDLPRPCANAKGVATSVDVCFDLSYFLYE